MIQEKFANHTEKIKEFGRKKGYPEDAMDLFLSVVFWEWDRKIFMRHYATLIDWSSPDYIEAIEEHNQNLIKLRKKLESTPTGRKSIQRIPKGVDDGRSTIIYPALPAEYIEPDGY